MSALHLNIFKFHYACTFFFSFIISNFPHLQHRYAGTKHHKNRHQQQNDEILVIVEDLRRLFTAIARDFSAWEKRGRFHSHFCGAHSLFTVWFTFHTRCSAQIPSRRIRRDVRRLFTPKNLLHCRIVFFARAAANEECNTHAEKKTQNTARNKRNKCNVRWSRRKSNKKTTTAQNKFSEGAREQIKRLRTHEISRNWAQARNIIFAEFLSCRGPNSSLEFPG